MNKEKLFVLGTGNALVYDCFNTCFVLQTEGGRLLVDCGGGNGILNQLRAAGIEFNTIHNIFLTHCHCDHFNGLVWVLRMIATAMSKDSYEGNLDIWCHNELAEMVFPVCRFMLGNKLSKYFDERIFVHEVTDGEKRVLCGTDFTFFDIRSTKAKQFAFTAQLSGGKLAFMGDEPVNENCEKYAENAQWLFSEAFCLYADAEHYQPYKKHHSTAKDAAELAQRLGAKRLLLWHTEEDHLAQRRQLYTAEAEKAFQGEIFVPDDLDVISL